MPQEKKNIITAPQVFRALRRVGSSKKAEIFKRFFKTGPGEYGAGDMFLGVIVPQSRLIAERHSAMPLSEIKKLLLSQFHEARFVGTIILTQKFKNGDAKEKQKIYEFYLRNARRINNWDLVDSSADKIVGAYLEGRNRNILFRLAKSKNIWERRIAIIATFAYIRKGDYRDTFRIAEIFLNDSHDLIHKATGWMLREVGKRSGIPILEKFLAKHGQRMPRTMLRYAIERFPEKKRQNYLRKKIL